MIATGPSRVGGPRARAPVGPRPRVARWGTVHSTSDAVLAALLSLAAVVVYVALAPAQSLQWFLVPVLACGALIGPDMMAWLRGRLDLVDPIGVVGVYGYFFFFVSPLILALTDYHTRGLPVPPDWLSWVGWAATLNVGALLVYRLGRSFMLRPMRQPAPWFTDPGQMGRAGLLVIPLTLGVALYTLATFGGLGGLIDAYSERNQAAFSGLGLQFLVGESFPNVLAMGVLVWKRNALRERGWWALALLVVGFFALRLVFGGLRGSRSNTVWSLIWLGGAIHLWIRPLNRRILAVSLAALMAFVYLYGFYKAQGRTAFDRLQEGEGIAEIQGTTGRTFTSTLLGDLSRVEIQAVLVQKVWEGYGYQLGMGETYLDTAMLLLPKEIRGQRPGGKIAKGTEAIFGQGTYVAQSYQASYVYGLLGEAMLNFHVVLAPLAFLLLAAWVSLARNTIQALHPDDVRRLVHPIWIVSSIAVLTGDSDNVLVFLLRTGLVPIAFAWLASRRAGRGVARRSALVAP